MKRMPYLSILVLLFGCLENAETSTTTETTPTAETEETNPPLGKAPATPELQADDPTQPDQKTEDTSDDSSPTDPSPVQMANPAAVKCAEDGGDSRTVETEAGQYSICIFVDDSECEEWAYFRGECNKGDCEHWETCDLSSDPGEDQDPSNDQDPGEDQDPSDDHGFTGMANPAAVKCIEDGLQHDIRTEDDGGQYGVCIFEDESECGSWAYFRDECNKGDCEAWETCDLNPNAEPPLIGMANPAAVKCSEDGVDSRTVETEAGQHGICIFEDGSECEEWAYFRGECEPGDCENWETCEE
ncbi:MAG: hypothetical protein A2284_11490 [Deltaproteobacteria bacterium RIFOXYA12_FULL_61_11]|nr:MAG: hypothetical protein A2284_11490 [Deltaproteobacteria bacterium RIFOXYA12_FULL_61_11]